MRIEAVRRRDGVGDDTAAVEQQVSDGLHYMISEGGGGEMDGWT